MCVFLHKDGELRVEHVELCEILRKNSWAGARRVSTVEPRRTEYGIPEVIFQKNP